MTCHNNLCFATHYSVQYIILIISLSYLDLFVLPHSLLRDCRVHLDYQDHQDLKETKYVSEKKLHPETMYCDFQLTVIPIATNMKDLLENKA